MVNSRLKIAFPLVCILLVVVFVTPAMAVDYAPGVSVGQWVKYNYIITSPGWETESKPAWAMIEIVEVSGKEVTLRISGEYENGTAITNVDGNPEVLTANIETGIISGQQRYIIAANLNEGDPILNKPGSDIINKTETRTYLGVSRSVNILNFTSSYMGYNLRVTFVYDKASGMSLEMETETTIIESGVTYEDSCSIIDTNIFGASSTPTPTPMPSPTQTPTPTPTSTPTDAPQQNSTIPFEWIALTAIVVLAVIVGALLILKKRK